MPSARGGRSGQLGKFGRREEGGSRSRFGRRAAGKAEGSCPPASEGGPPRRAPVITAKGAMGETPPPPGAILVFPDQVAVPGACLSQGSGAAAEGDFGFSPQAEREEEGGGFPSPPCSLQSWEWRFFGRRTMEPPPDPPPPQSFARN